MAVHPSTILRLSTQRANVTHSETQTKSCSSMTNWTHSRWKTHPVRVCYNLSTSRHKSRQSPIYGRGKIRSNWKSRLMIYLRMVKCTWSAHSIQVSGWISRRSSTSWSLRKDRSLLFPARTKFGRSHAAKPACLVRGETAFLPISRSHTRLTLSKGPLRKTF